MRGKARRRAAAISLLMAAFSLSAARGGASSSATTGGWGAASPASTEAPGGGGVPSASADTSDPAAPGRTEAFPVAVEASGGGSADAAALADVPLRDSVREAAARALMETLRCLVCQGQSIADSDADMARDMRALVRGQVDRGEEPAAVRDWLIQRYGAYVTYDPPLSAATLPLWLAPLALLALGAWVARASFRRRPHGGRGG